jgi:hypothetical protein
MARGTKSKYTSRQRRQAQVIEENGKGRGTSTKRAAQMAYATVNKQDGGGKKSRSSRGRKRSNVSSRTGGQQARRGSQSSRR